MTCTLGACAEEGVRGVVGLLTTCIVGFVFSFPVGSLGGLMGALFRRGYVGKKLVYCLKSLWRSLIARSCSSHI